MEIAFRTKALRSICLSGEKMNEQYGAEAAALLKRCIADMRAAENLADIQSLGYPLSPSSQHDEALLTLENKLFVTLRVNHSKPPILSDGSINWPHVDRVFLKQIERPHG